MVIFGKKIRVKRIKDLAKNHGLAGYFDPHKNIIAIDSELKGNAYMQTMLHECIHATLDRVGVTQTRVSHDAHEMIAENIATAIVENFNLKKK